MSYRGMKSRADRAFECARSHLISRYKRMNRDSLRVQNLQIYKDRLELSENCYQRPEHRGPGLPNPKQVFVGTPEEAERLAAMEEEINQSYFVSSEERSRIQREQRRLEQRYIKTKNSRIVATYAAEIVELMLCEPPEPAFSGLRAKPKLRLRSLLSLSMPLLARPSIQPNAPTF